MNKKWLFFHKVNPKAKFRIFLFPYAGGGASTYLSWLERFPDNFEIATVNPPGRGNRINEPPLENMTEMVEGLIACMAAHLDKPFAFFGHSFGASFAYEVVFQLRKRGFNLPVHFFASGRRAPHLPPRRPPWHNLPDKEFREEIEKLNGMPPRILKNDELMEIFTPILRADVKVANEYRREPEELLSFGVSVLGGTQDVSIRKEDIGQWQAHFSQPIDLRMFDGTHFFIEEKKDEVIKCILDVFSALDVQFPDLESISAC